MIDRSASSPPIRSDGLQIDEHRSLQVFHWRLERVAWGTFLAIVVAALLGLTGGEGRLARNTLDHGSAQAEVPAVARWQEPDNMTVSFDAAGPHVIRFGPGLAEWFDVASVTPRPVHESATSEGLRLEVEAAGGTVHLSIRPRSPGLARYDLEIDGATVSARTLIIP